METKTYCFTFMTIQEQEESQQTYQIDSKKNLIEGTKEKLENSSYIKSDN